jgi:DNA invertase Pin-like site-specific DNA recombinase
MQARSAQFVAYYRVSTDRQGRSGLGLEAQREAVQRHMASVGGTLIAEHTEIETGKRNDRPELQKALAAVLRLNPHPVRAPGHCVWTVQLDREIGY